MSTAELARRVAADAAELHSRLTTPKKPEHPAMAAAERIMRQFVSEFEVDGDVEAGREACKRQIAAIIEEECGKSSTTE